MIEEKILLIVGDTHNKEKYSHYLKDVIDVDLVSSLQEAYNNCLKNHYELILIDLKLSFGLGLVKLEERLNSLTNPPPTFKIRPREDRVEVILLEQRTVEELISFLNKFYTRLKEERSTNIDRRKLVRNKLILRVIMKNDRYSSSIKANTLNISQEGLFITTTVPFERNDDIIVHIYDAFSDPIHATMQVAWIRPWDVPHQLPGIGASFLSFARDADQYNLIKYISSSFRSQKNPAPESGPGQSPRL